MAERLIITEYSGVAGDRIGHAASLEGALRAATIRVATGQYLEARIYDARFGKKSIALLVARFDTGLRVRWTKTPRWTKK